MSVVQSYRSLLLWIDPNGNLISIPAFMGMTLSLPSNYNLPRPIGNVAIVNFSPSTRIPTLEVPIAIRDVNNDVLSITGDFNNPAFLDYFVTRGSVSDTINLNDTLVMGTFILWDGLNATYITNVRAESFQLATSRGDDLIFLARFTGSVSYTVYPGDEGWIDYTGYANYGRDPILRFQSVNVNDTFGFNYNSVWSMKMALINNHVPDYFLDLYSSGGFPLDSHAGTPTASLQLMVQADNGFVDAAQVQYAPPEIVVTIQGRAGFCQFTFPNPINRSRDSVAINSSRVFRTYAYDTIGSWQNGEYFAPVFIESTF